MTNLKQRKAELAERTRNESLRFQTEWGMKQLSWEPTGDIRGRIDDELRILQNLGLAENLLTLKEIVTGVSSDLGARPEPFEGNLAGSLVAYLLGISTGNPLEKQLLLPVTEYAVPWQVSVKYDNEIRNEVVDWIRTHGYKEVKTRLGQPILKMDKMVVEIRRMVKQ